MKKLPIGIQSISEVIRGGCIYVDKTKFARQLIIEGKYYFMARPRRFGKSLFISTLKSILSGDRELFQGCQIDNSDYEWKAYPIIHLDFTQILISSSKNLEDSLKRTLASIADSYGISVEIPSSQEGLANLVKALSKEEKVAVLVDEYDKALVDNLAHLDIAEENRYLLKGFFGTLKGLDEYLKLVFMTGVSKFSQVSLFSGLNNLTDITMDPNYADMMGYTEDELHQFFSPHIQEIAKKRSKKGDRILESQIFEEMRNWYNGYRFSERECSVYNPYSTLRFLSHGKVKSYWYSTGTPSFLIEHIRKQPESVAPLSEAIATESDLSDIRSLDKTNLIPLMFQTGYLTIQDYNPDQNFFYLGFPNQEVRNAFFDSLLKEFIEITPISVSIHSQETKRDLANRDLNSFFSKINTYFAKIPYHLFSGAKEGFYHAVFLILLEGLEIKTRAEDPTNIGRIDIAFDVSNTIYILELKLDLGAELAFEQTQFKKYKEKYSQIGKEIVLVGINFSSISRNVSDWKAEIFSSAGVKLKELQSSPSINQQLPQ